LEKAPDKQSGDDVQLARARRDEIEANLAKLRDPQLTVLPDHFIWQKLPKASLMRNPGWARPFSQKLELVLGSSSYLIEPRWTSDPLADIEAALKNSGAPVTFAWAKRRQYRVANKNQDPNSSPKPHDIDSLQIRIGTQEQFVNGLGHTPILTTSLKSPLKPGDYFLLVRHDQYKITVPANDELAQDFKAVVERSRAPVSREPGTILKANGSTTRWTELRPSNDSKTNLLNDGAFTEGAPTMTMPFCRRAACVTRSSTKSSTRSSRALPKRRGRCWKTWTSGWRRRISITCCSPRIE
jgi:hypothetical protein